MTFKWKPMPGKCLDVDVRKHNYTKPDSTSYVFVTLDDNTISFDTHEEFEEFMRQMNDAADEAFGAKKP